MKDCLIITGFCVILCLVFFIAYFLAKRTTSSMDFKEEIESDCKYDKVLLLHNFILEYNVVYKKYYPKYKEKYYLGGFPAFQFRTYIDRTRDCKVPGFKTKKSAKKFVKKFIKINTNPISKYYSV